MATYPNILKAGLQASYVALETKDANVLYFCTDTGKIYKGAVDFTNSVVVATSKPETPIVGKLYVLADTNTCEIYTGSAWKVVSYPVATTVDVSSDDLHVASAKAVYDAIQDAVSGLAGSSSSIKKIEAGEEAATIKITKGNDTSSNVVVPGVVTKPTWDAVARKLTIPVTGEDTAVEVNIGKDIFLDPAGANRYNAETNSIELYLNDGSEGKESTKISIPAAGLVDVCTGENSNGVITSVSDDNKIKVSLVIDPVEGNALVLTETGLKVDLSAYATTETVNTKTSALQTAVEAAQADATYAKTAVDKLNGAAEEEGSVDYKIAQSKSVTDQSIKALSDKLDTNAENIQTNTDNLAALATATTEWGTF